MAKRGFAAMDRERVRAISSMGGKAAHAAGTAHRFSSEEASAAGRKGGLTSHARRRAQQLPLPYEEDEGPATQRAPSMGDAA